MALAKRPGRRQREAGQAVIMVTLGITFLLGLLGLVVDVGYGYYVKQAAQGAADAAVMAAITAVGTNPSCGGSVQCQTGYSCPSNASNATDFGVACLYAQSNGFTNGNGQTVTLSSGTGVPPTAPGINTKYWITATVSQQLTLGFLTAMGVQGGMASAQATGGVVIGPATNGCIFALDPSGNQAMKVNGSKSVVQTDCGVYVNSTSSDALDVSGSVSASEVNVVGNVKANGGGSISPTAKTGVTAIADPLASLPAPTYSGCDYTNYSVSGGNVTLSQGVYCNGISITGQANVTFNPGTYILNGGGLSASGSNTVLTGSGVMFYNTASSGKSFGPISLAGGTTVNLTAPTSGTYQGILFFQDRGITSSAQSSITGGSSVSMTGSIYMPTGQLVFSGGTSTSSLTVAIIVYDLTVSGSSNLSGDTTGALTGLATVTSSLVQ